MTALTGKRFWLIGASVGIGKQLALQLAKEGVAVVVSARNEVTINQLLLQMESVSTGKGTHQAVVCDVTKDERVKTAFDLVGEIDGVIYCAGAYEPMSARKPDIATLKTMVDVNLTGALRVLNQCVPAFLSRGYGHIVLFGSISGYLGLPNAWGYGATKAALIHLSENLRCDLRNTGILVQICNPGFVATRLTNKNNFKMPLIMTPEAAAGKIIIGMKKGRFEIAFPYFMSATLKLFAAIPRPLYFKLLALFGDKQGLSS